MGASSPVVFETERLAFREMNQDDFLDLAEMLQNPKVMYAYEHDFSNSDVQQWLDRQIGRYRDYGFGLWAVISKTSGVMVGQAGLTMQPYRNKDVLEIGYLLKKEFWHGRDWSDWTPARFIEELGGWIGRYNTERRSDALGGRTPAEFRSALGRAA